MCVVAQVLNGRRRNTHIDHVLEAVPGSLTTFHHKLTNNAPLVVSILQGQKYLQGYPVINVTKPFAVTLFSSLKTKLSYNLVSVFSSRTVEPFWERDFLTGP